MTDAPSPSSDDSDSRLGRRTFLAGAAAAGTGFAVAGLAGRAGAAPLADFPFPTSSSFRVLVLGDGGTGLQPQWAVADAIRRYHAKQPIGMAVALGDNIYETGPKSAGDNDFQTKFEKPYRGLDFPWAMVLGNHDNSAVIPGDGAWLLRGNDEVAYSKRSRRWHMPRRYYSVKVPEKNPVAEFFVLDLNPLAAYVPPLFDPFWTADGTFMNNQRRWLKDGLDRSTARWKFVCSHFPYINNGPHGNAGEYDGVPISPINGLPAKIFFEKYVLGRAQFMLAGHDHSLQVFKSTMQTKGTSQIVSGAGAKSVGGKKTDKNTSAFQNMRDRGFMILDVSPTAVHLEAHTVDLPTGTSRVAYTTNWS